MQVAKRGAEVREEHDLLGRALCQVLAEPRAQALVLRIMAPEYDIVAQRGRPHDQLPDQRTRAVEADAGAGVLEHLFFARRPVPPPPAQCRRHAARHLSLWRHEEKCLVPALAGSVLPDYLGHCVIEGTFWLGQRDRFRYRLTHHAPFRDLPLASASHDMAQKVDTLQ